MEFVPALALVALLLKFIDFLKSASARDVNAVVTQLVAWVSGIVVVLLFAQTDFAGSIEINGTTLGLLNAWSQVIVGLTLASTASVVSDGLRAVDNSVATKDPKLLG
jgi:hypothetical protein